MIKNRHEFNEKTLEYIDLVKETMKIGTEHFTDKPNQVQIHHWQDHTGTMIILYLGKDC